MFVVKKIKKKKKTGIREIREKWHKTICIIHSQFSIGKIFSIFFIKIKEPYVDYTIQGLFCYYVVRTFIGMIFKIRYDFIGGRLTKVLTICI